MITSQQSSQPFNKQLSQSTQALLTCPICQSALNATSERLVCQNLDCQASYPVVDQIPVLINESNSIFSLSDFVARQDTTFNFQSESKLKKFLSQKLPDFSVNLKGKENYQKFLKAVLQFNPKPKILVLGGGILGDGMEEVFNNPNLEIVSTDVSFGPCTALICDAHDIPFQSDSFDGVIVQAVLEHVLDPTRCVEEIYRVLKPGGLVYAETPFMQQVHMGRYDFTRFTHLGHRRLFRKFTELSSGPVCGPGMALAWSYQYFLLSFVKSEKAKLFVKAFSRLTAFWLTYFDYLLIDRPGSFDAASGYYFLGEKTLEILSDRELIRLYKGLQ